QPLVVRIDLDDSRLTRALDGIPMIVLNRSAQRGPAQIDVTLEQQNASQTVDLNGQPVQAVVVAMKIDKAGKHNLSAALRVGDAKEPLFVDKRKVLVPPPIAMMPTIPTHWCIEDGSPKISGEVDLSI